MTAFEHTFHVGWGQMDFNAHMANTGYLDFAADTRMMFFETNGFTVSDFMRLRVGPVAMRDELDYFREVCLLDSVRVTLALAGMSEYGSRFRLQNEMFGKDGSRLARVVSVGGWLDLDARKLRRPPSDLFAVMQSLPRTQDFINLPESVR